MFLLLKPNSNNIKSINHDNCNNSYASIKMLFTLSWASDCNKILPCPTSSVVYLSGTIVLVVDATKLAENTQNIYSVFQIMQYINMSSFTGWSCLACIVENVLINPLDLVSWIWAHTFFFLFFFSILKACCFSF